MGSFIPSRGGLLGAGQPAKRVRLFESIARRRCVRQHRSSPVRILYPRQARESQASSNQKCVGDDELGRNRLRIARWSYQPSPRAEG